MQETRFRQALSEVVLRPSSLLLLVLSSLAAGRAGADGGLELAQAAFDRPARRDVSTMSGVRELATSHATRLIVEVARVDRKLPAKLCTPRALAGEGIESGDCP
jgi:hypothetical protein